MNGCRVSNIEAFRQWRDDDEAELSDLVSRVVGTFEPTEAMQAGTAFHKALEVAAEGFAAALETEGYRFHIDCDITVELAAIREIRASKTYMVDGLPFIVSGQLDAIEGKRIDDHKTTSRFDPERYLDGYQWRLYLDIFDADLFRWNVFEIKQEAVLESGFQEWTVTAAHRLEQHRYPELGEDCARIVGQFARLVRSAAWAKCVAEVTAPLEA